MERAPSLRQASRFTRGSVSVSSQIDDLRGAEAGPGEGGITVNARADVGPNRARRSPQDNLIVFGQGDGQTIRAGDGDRAFGDELQHFIENELLSRAQTPRRELRHRSRCCRAARAFLRRT